MMYYTTEQIVDNSGCDPNIEPFECSLKVWSTIGVFGHIGFAMFVFEGNAAVINIRAETKNAEKYPKILVSAIVTMLSLFILFSMLAYGAYKQ